MPVDTVHPDYSTFKPMWDKCRDVIAGQTAVHKAGKLYLPELTGEKPDPYAARKLRALFFNATSRTVYALQGMLFRTPPVIKVSKAAEGFLADVTQTGKALLDLAKLCAVEALAVGRVGLLVDYPRKGDADNLTIAQVEALGLRPKIAVYKTEAILNWERVWLNNRFVLTLVVLAETYVEKNSEDEFAGTTRKQYRVLDLDPRELIAGAKNPGFGHYRQRLFREGAVAGKFESTGDIYPLLAGALMTEIPFVFIGVDTTEPEVEEPPLADLVHANISHYQTTADVEHGAHKTALPQPWATGVTPEAGEVFVIGGEEIWTNPDAGGQFGMLEYTGQGLGALETRLLRKEAYMAVLGARMLEDQKKGIETAQTAGMHRSGEHATLASQGATLDAGLTRALDWFDKWAGGPGGCTFTTNRDFLPAGLTAQEVTALMGAWQQGGISDQELFEKFQKGGVVRENKEFAEHETEIANAAPKLLTAPAPAPAAT